MQYSPVTPAIIQMLIDIVGPAHVIYNDAELLEPFSRDEIPGTHYRSMPEAVVHPDGAEQIAAIVRLANRERVPLTPRGAGSGLSGGAVPIHGGIVVCSDRMNRILEFDRQNMMVVVEPGVITNQINEAVKDAGLFYAGYPMSVETCFIGGNVAENAGGGKAVKYGVTARYVLGLEMVTPTGQIVQLGGKLLKDVTGYNMVQLMVGSEGTLGFFTKIILKLSPRPKYQVDLLCLYPTGEQAIDTVPQIISGSGITPTSIEYMDAIAFQEACRFINEPLPCSDCEAMLLITLDGFDLQQIQREYDEVGQFCLKSGATEVYVADTAANSERVWKIRRSIPEAYSQKSRLQSGEDIVVPPAEIHTVSKQFRFIAQKYGVMIPCYGHAGDGNLHARITPPADWTEERWYKTLPEALTEIYTAVKQVGGRISGEHGIGHKRKPYMRTVVSEEYLNMLRAIKKALDPNNIMNPGKIFDLEI